MIRRFQFNLKQLLMTVTVVAGWLWIAPAAIESLVGFMVVVLGFCTSIGTVFDKPFAGFISAVFLLFGMFACVLILLAVLSLTGGFD